MMKYFAMFVVVAIAFAPGSASATWMTYSNDFESGIGPELSVVNETGLYTVDTANSVLRISKPEDDGTIETTGVTTAGIATNFHLVGDFTVTVGFNFDDFPIATYPGLNESQLRLVGVQSNDIFALIHYTRYGLPKYKYGVWLGEYYSTSTASNGRYRITRNGSNMATYLAEGSGDFVLDWQGTGFTDDVQVYLLGLQGTNIYGNNRSTTSLDISFDNLDIIAEGIVVPEPSSLIFLLMGATALLVFRRK